jgi:hypothetical protein
MLQNDTLNDGKSLERYSFGLYKTSNKALNYWHRGSLFGFKSIISYYPEKDFGLVILGNVQTFNRIKYARQVTRLICAEIAPDEPVSSSQPILDASSINKRIPVDADMLKRYEGNYVVAPMTVYMIRAQDNALSLLEVGSTGSVNLTPIAENQFRNDGGSLIVSFSENQGIVDRMIYQTASEEITGVRAKVLSSSQEQEITGDYYNNELEIWVTIERPGKGLGAHNLILGDVLLYPTFEDQFRSDHDFFTYLTFYRNSNSRIEGFLLDGFGVRKMKFHRVIKQP